MAVKKAVLDRATIESMVAEYNELRVREKTIAERKKVLSEAIKNFVKENGVKDSKGSFYAENNDFTYGAMCKKSIKFDTEKAVSFFESINHKECIEYVPTVNEDAVEQLVADGVIDTDALETITKTTTTYSVDVRAKNEEMPEVEVSTIAASKKPVKKIRK